MDPFVQSQIKDWFLMITTFTFIGTLVYIIATTLRRRQRHQMQQHVLDKFASAKDFADFLQTPAGQKYVMNFAETSAGIKGSILNSVRIGIVLMFIGFGLQTLNSAAMRIGLLVVAIGIGFLVSAGVSYVLAKKIHVNGGE
jgi:hypothetical protein